ncbi:TatD family hydrolase [Betaproteobacteria bacterium]|nr:TatD family hydrolase [Betaproteobacteria bacterium]
MGLNNFADSHCHLNYPGLMEQQSDVIKRMKKAGIAYALNVCTKLEEFDDIITTVDKYDFIYASVGVHPDNVNVKEPTTDEICHFSNNEKVVAIGETGLDYFRLKGDLTWQRDRFRRHIRAARDVKKPLIIHMRDATDDTLNILKQEKAHEIGGVMHCFTETLDIAKKAIDLNFYISISGIVTFKNADQVQHVAKNVPLDRLLIETDSPFLAPVPYRGKTNEPSFVIQVAEKIAHLRSEPVDLVAVGTKENFLSFIQKQ